MTSLTAYMKSARRLLLPAACIVVLSLMAVGTDLVLWRMLDHGQAPIRALTLGDQDYYILRVHATLLAGRPIGSPFFQEHALIHPRYVLFESFIALLGKIAVPFIGTNATVWANLIRLLTLAALFFEWRYVFRRWAGLTSVAASIAALCLNLWLEPFTIQAGFALGSWFMPVALAGFMCLIRGFESKRGAARLVWTIAATLLSTIHPIIFVTSALTGGFLWLARFIRYRDRTSFAEAFAWSLPTFLLGLSLYGGFAFPDPVVAKAAADTLLRNAAIATHLLVMPLINVHLLGLLILVAILRRYDDVRRTAWDVLLAATTAMLLGTSANLFTGRYFLGDHYAFFEAFIAAFASALALTMPPPTSGHREKIFASIVGAGLAANVVGLLVGHPFRAWLALGVFVPYFLAGAVMIWTILGRTFMPSVVTKWIVPSIVVVSLFYPAVFLWRLERGYVPAHAQAEEARPLLDTLAKLPQGTVLSDDALSGLVAMDTPDRPYWSTRAFIDEASNDELRKRWHDALVFFAEQPWTRDASAKAGLYGAEDQFCGGLAEKIFYGPLKASGLIGASLCRRTLDDAGWQALAKKETSVALNERNDGVWKPSYRLDYVVIDRSKQERMPTMLAKRFAMVFDGARYAVYHYLPMP